MAASALPSTLVPAAAPAGRTRALRGLAVAAMLTATAFGVPRFLTHAPYPRLGAAVDWRSPDGVVKIREVFGPPARGMLQKGDILREIDGKVATLDGFRKLRLAGGLPRGPLPILVERHGRPLKLVLPPVRLGAWQRVRLFTFPLAAMIAAPLVAFLLVWRRPDLSTAWVFMWFTMLQALGVLWGIFQYPQSEPAGLFAAYLKVYDALTWWFPASFLHFMTVFPRPRWTRRSQWASPWFWFVVLAYVIPPVLWVTAGGLGTPSAEKAFVIYMTGAMLLGTLSLIDRYARPLPGRSPGWSERVLALAVAVTLLLATTTRVISEDPRIYAWYSLALVRLAFTTISVAWMLSPLFIAFLIAHDPAFDPRRILVQSLPYALLSGVLAALYLGIVVVAQRLFAHATGEDAVVFNVVAALIVAFAFAPLRGRLQGGLDRLFGRDPEAVRAALDEAGHALLGALDRDQIRASVEQALARGLKREVALQWPESGPPRLAPEEVLPDHASAAVENLLLQAGIRLENLALAAHRAAAERESVELREAATRAELRALHAQVQPHFLFNALNALSYLIETDPPAAQRFTERLADMLRYTVEAGSRPAALLSEELGFVEDYLGVAGERYENALEFKFHGARELLSTAVPPLLLQPLVENSLKHGCPPGTNALHLELTAERQNGHIELTFSDDGTNGHGPSSPSLGVGLHNLEQRLRRFAGPSASMSAGPRQQGGFAVRLRWQVRETAA
ncbi:MAG TPA: histidine kinase [Candidatus Eisenbacteria bacterium]|nr:histidine kinase [Candidatus Eisenbacteria bacterium]